MCRRHATYDRCVHLYGLLFDSSWPDHSAATTCIDDGDSSPNPAVPTPSPPSPLGASLVTVAGNTTLAATTRRPLDRGEYVRRRGEWFDITEAGTAAGKEPEAGKGEVGDGEEAAEETTDESELNDADDGSRGCEPDPGSGEAVRGVSSLLSPCCDRFFRNVRAGAKPPLAPAVVTVMTSGSCCDCDRDRLFGWSDER